MVSKKFETVSGAVSRATLPSYGPAGFQYEGPGMGSWDRVVGKPPGSPNGSSSTMGCEGRVSTAPDQLPAKLLLSNSW